MDFRQKYYSTFREPIRQHYTAGSVDFNAGFNIVEN